MKYDATREDDASSNFRNASFERRNWGVNGGKRSAVVEKEKVSSCLWACSKVMINPLNCVWLRHTHGS